MEESENQLVENLDESGETDMIMVSSTELEKDEQDDSENGEEIEIEDEESAKEEDESSNDAKDQSEDNVAAESEVVETVVDKKTPQKSAQKKTKKKDKGKLLITHTKPQTNTHREEKLWFVWTGQRAKSMNSQLLFHMWSEIYVVSNLIAMQSRCVQTVSALIVFLQKKKAF